MRVALIRGDGIGPEIVDSAVRVLDHIKAKYGLEIEYSDVKAGGCSIDEYGCPLKESELEKAKEADAVLLGAVGGPKWDRGTLKERPEGALLRLREALETYSNIRPVKIYEPLKGASPLKNEIIEGGVDLIIIRELTGGLYYGKRGTDKDDSYAFDTMEYRRGEIERAARRAFETARGRCGRVTLVDKANVLETSRLWRRLVTAMKPDDIELDYLYVDNASMQLVRDPGRFDVILTENMFGDILSDEASVITGSIGMIPSASLGDGSRGLYEPIHGSAPDIAGKGTANPLATILAAAMMLRYSFGLEEEAREIEGAVESAILYGARTKDIAKKGEDYITTREMTDEVIRRIM